MPLGLDFQQFARDGIGQRQNQLWIRTPPHSLDGLDQGLSHAGYIEGFGLARSCDDGRNGADGSDFFPGESQEILPVGAELVGHTFGSLPACNPIDGGFFRVLTRIKH